MLILARSDIDNHRVLGREARPDGAYVMDLLSRCYQLDRIYMSMTGPRSNQGNLRLDPNAPATDTLWLTGVRTDIVDADSLEIISPEFFCHANLTLSPASTTPAEHHAGVGMSLSSDWRLFTLVPGRMQLELPPGFGVPIKNATKVDYYTMALNQNPGPARQVRMRTQIRFHRDTGDTAMTPVAMRALYVYQQHVTVGSVTANSSDTICYSHTGEACASASDLLQKGRTPSRFARLINSSQNYVHPGADCCVVNASRDGIVSQFGQENTVHWMVPPGRHQFRSEVTEQLRLSSNTTVHYVTGHLHPFGKSLVLRDMNEGATVFRIESQDFPDRLGVRQISEIVSLPGISLQRGHRYELVAEYDNTCSKPVDAMGILYIYARAADLTMAAPTMTQGSSQ